MIDGVEECFEIAINNVALFPFWKSFCVHLRDGMMRTPSRSKPVGAVAEDGFVLWRKGL